MGPILEAPSPCFLSSHYFQLEMGSLGSTVHLTSFTAATGVWQIGTPPPQVGTHLEAEPRWGKTGKQGHWLWVGACQIGWCTKLLNPFAAINKPRWTAEPAVRAHLYFQPFEKKLNPGNCTIRMILQPTIIWATNFPPPLWYSKRKDTIGYERALFYLYTCEVHESQRCC